MYKCSECGNETEEINNGGQCYDCWEKDVGRMP